MKHKVIIFLILCIFLNAQEEKQENKKSIVESSKDELVSLPFLQDAKNKKDDRINLLEANRFNNFDNFDVEKLPKVTLMDVVLETVATNSLVKAAREKVVQNQIKLDDAIAVYYPTLNFEYGDGRNQETDTSASATKRFKYFNDRNYKFILNQNLYAGGETANNIRNLDKKLEIAKNQYQIDLSTQVTNAVKAYFDVVFAYKTLKANEKNMEKLKKILEIVNAKYDSGASSIGDLNAIKANVANADTALVKVKSDLIKAMRYYEYIVGENYSQTLPYERNFNIDLTTFDLLYDRALTQNQDLIYFYKSIEAEKINLETKKSGFDPKVDFEMYVDNVMDKDGFTQRDQTFNGKVKLTYNLFNGGKDQNKLLTSYSTIRELNYNLEESKRKLKWNIAELYTSIKSNKESLKSNISEVMSLRKMVDAYWEEFTLGEQDINTLLQGQKQLNTAETELIKFEKANITDFFTLLSYTGDLLAFFDLDPQNPKFINFANANYSQDLYIDDKFLNEQEKIEKNEKELKEIKEQEKLASKAKQDQNIDNFRKKLLASPDNMYTLKIDAFKNFAEAVSFIKNNNIDMDSFAFDKVNNQTIDSLIVYGVFDKKQKAEEQIGILKEKIQNKEISIVKVKNVKELFEKYKAGLVIEPTPPDVKVVEKVETVEKIKQLKEVNLDLNDNFRSKFLNANPGYYTIHISSFANKLDILNVLSSRTDLKNDTFVYSYMDNAILFRWVYGIFEKYEDAVTAMNKLGKIRDDFYPIVSKIENELSLYDANRDLNKKIEPQAQDFEYVKESSKTEYKDPVDVQKIDVKKDKELGEKVKGLLPKNEKKEDLKVATKEDEQDNTLPTSSEKVVKENKTNDTFKNKFINASRSAYTINLATITVDEKVEEFLSKNDIMDNSFGFKVGEKQKVIRVVYGVYQTKEEAEKAIEGLPNRILKAGKPFVEQISRNQDLYKLYNEPQQEIKPKSLLDKELISSSVSVKVLPVVDQKPKVGESTPVVESTPVIEATPKEDQLSEVEFKENVVSNFAVKDFDKYNNQTFKAKFLSSPKNYYTVNLGTLKKVNEIENFLSQNPEINKNEIFTYTLGTKLDKVIVLSGIYATEEEALASIKKLNSKFVKENDPFVEKVAKKQEIYLKHHGIK